MLVACRLAGLSALEGAHADVSIAAVAAMRSWRRPARRTIPAGQTRSKARAPADRSVFGGLSALALADLR
jgi:hypothetical protein